MWDKGGNDLYVTRQLLSLHDRFGSNKVKFIMGNRDINKIRILQEIGIATADDENKKTHENDSCENLPAHGGIFWFKGTGLQGDPDLIRKRNDENMQSKECQSTSIDG
eukprot:418327_1